MLVTGACVLRYREVVSIRYGVLIAILKKSHPEANSGSKEAKGLIISRISFKITISEKVRL